jgi:hypothetical protein
MKFTVNSKSPKLGEDTGILYLVLFELDGKQLVKIGVTTRAIEDRVSEILVSIFKKYREFCYCRPKRFTKTTNMFEKEATLHRYFKKYKYTPVKPFSGSSEFFDIPLDDAVAAYERLLAGEQLDESGYEQLSDS